MTTHQTAAQQVATLRAKITALQAERAALLSQSRSRGDVLRAVDNLIDHWHSQGMQSLSRELQRAASGDMPELFAVHGSAISNGQPGAAPVTLNLGPLLVALIGAEPVRKLIALAAEQVPAGLEAKARAARLAKIAAELDTVEHEEEQLIVRSGIEGSPIDRRADARAEIVLSVNS